MADTTNQQANPEAGQQQAEPTELDKLIQQATAPEGGQTAAPEGEPISGTVSKKQYVDLQKAHERTVAQLNSVLAATSLQPVVEAITSQAAELRQLRQEQVAEKITGLLDAGDEASTKKARDLAQRENSRLIKEIGLDTTLPEFKPLMEADPLTVYQGLLLVGSPLQRALATASKAQAAAQAQPATTQPKPGEKSKEETEKELREKIERETIQKFGLFNFASPAGLVGGAAGQPATLAQAGSFIRDALEGK